MDRLSDRSRLFATNYLQAGLLAVCSQVTLLERDEERLRFRVEATGRVYEYYFHEAIRSPAQPAGLVMTTTASSATERAHA